MHPLTYFDLYLFDFDGLLVNTEKLHYLAYIKMCAQRGVELTWDFPTYSSYAHFSATLIQEELYRQFPQIRIQEPQWSVLYQEKKAAYYELLQSTEDLLMPGVAELLQGLKKWNIPSCVVTHSPLEQITLIRKKNPLLDLIPHWITREDYTHPKPSPECYEKAIQLYGQGKKRIVGFEDAPRGFTALAQTRATPVLISSAFTPQEAQKFHPTPFLHYPSLENFLVVDR